MDSRRPIGFVSVLIVVAVVVVAWRAIDDSGDGREGSAAIATMATISSDATSDNADAVVTTTADTFGSPTSTVSPTTSPAPTDSMSTANLLEGGSGTAPSGSLFADLVVRRFEEQGLDPSLACDVSNPGVDRVLSDYGAVFVARGVSTPPACIFADNGATERFQGTLDSVSATIAGTTVTLQRPAMDSLQGAIDEGSSLGLTITPRGSEASARSFNTSRDLWFSRVEPGLDRYVSDGRISSARADEIRSMANLEQIATILDLESRGMSFGLNQSGSIMSSVAPPGSTQHHSLLALDVAEYANAGVREALARHGWFQTIVSDEPHFTYLGVQESELSSLGLRAVEEGPYRYWVPAR